MGDVPADNDAALGHQKKGRPSGCKAVFAGDGPGHGDDSTRVCAVVQVAELESEDTSAVSRAATQEDGKQRMLEVRRGSVELAVLEAQEGLV